MNIDFDKLKYSLTGEYEEVMLEKQLKEKEKEIERLNNIINEIDGYLDLKRESYIEGFKWSGLEVIDQAKDFLQELKGSDK